MDNRLITSLAQYAYKPKTADERLRQATYAQKEVETLEATRSAYREKYGNTLKSVDYGSVRSSHGGGSRGPVERAVMALTSYDDQIATAIEKLTKARIEAENMIAMLDDGIDRDIMRRYYINGETIDSVAAAIHYEPLTVKRRKKKALDYIDSILETLPQ